MFVTRFGVSVENVVATIETPTSHHGAARPEVKNSAVLFPARFAKKIAGRKDTTTDAPMMLQSRGFRCIRVPPRAAISERRAEPFPPGPRAFHEPEKRRVLPQAIEVRVLFKEGIAGHPLRGCFFQPGDGIGL